MNNGSFESPNNLEKFIDELEEIVSTNFDLTGRKIGDNFPAVDIIEEDTIYRISADLPGMSKDDFLVNIEQDILTISGEKKSHIPSTNKNRYHHFERNFGSFNRSFNLPANVNSESVEAFYKDGVLEITLQKTESGHNNPIEIKIE
jgi:HSP20 family protein